MERTNGLKESEEGLIVGFGWVSRGNVVSGSIRQLPVRLNNIIILAEDHSATALVFWEDKDVGIGLFSPWWHIFFLYT